MTLDLMTYLRRYRPGITREEAALASGISIATLTRRLREGLDADEVMKAARYVGASPVEALIELELLEWEDLEAARTARTLEVFSDRDLLEELLARVVAVEDAEIVDREEAGLPPQGRRRYVPNPLFTLDLSQAQDTLADAADTGDGHDHEDEDETRERD